MDSEQIDLPLVSIIVITYNSAKYLVDTLESIKDQTYKRIELIISDDFSSDDTISICQNWVAQNAERFVNTNIILAERNTGIPANCNRGANKATGEWLKFIAGDDFLANTYIEVLLENAAAKDFPVNMCCNHFTFWNNDVSKKKRSCYEKTQYFTEPTNGGEQFQTALRIAGTVPAITAMFRKSIFDKVGGFDEEFKILEDYPFFLRVNQVGEKIYFVTDCLVYYRRHDSNATRKQSLIIGPVLENVFDFRYKYCSPLLPPIERAGLKYEYRISRLILLVQRKSLPFLAIWKFIYEYQFLFNPFFIYRNLVRITGKKYKFYKYLYNQSL